MDWQELLRQQNVELTDHLELEKVLISPSGGRMLICFLADTLVGEDGFLKVKRAFARSFPETRVSLRIASPALAEDLKENLSKYTDFISACLVRHYPAIRGWLGDAGWRFESSGAIELRLSLPIAVTYFEQHQLAERLTQIVDDVFRLRLPVHVVLAENVERTVERILVERREEEERFRQEISIKQAEAEKSRPKNQEAEASTRVYGRKINEPPVPISELLEDSGKVVVCGEVVESNSRELKGGEMVLVTFAVTDFEGTMACKLFLRYKQRRRSGEQAEGPPTEAERKVVQDIVEGLAAGAYLTVSGEVQRDNYTRDLCLMVSAAQRAPRPTRTDDAQEKRIELHLHTQMSNMDATASAADLIAQAAAWGHEAIAVTDHGVVQAFPEAFAAAKKHKIKLLPGMEGYLSNETAAVHQADERELTRPIVVLDFETTGLSPQQDRIIEIGAVRMQNGQIVEEFEMLVQPGRSVPAAASKVNGITDAMLLSAPRSETALPKLLDFIGGSAIAAHNAPFDTAFLQEECNRLGLEFRAPVIDTLELARRLYPQMKSHRLGAVCKKLGVSLKNAHRAVHDARATAGCLIRMIEQLASQEIFTLLDLTDMLQAGAIGSAHHVILLAKNQLGMEHLNRLVSEGFLSHFRRRPHIPRTLLMKYREGLILGTACESGELFQAVLAGESDETLERIASFYDFLEIQPTGNNAFLIREGRVEDEEALQAMNLRILRLGEKLGKPVVATGDVHFLHPEHARARAVLMAAHGFKDADEQPPLYFKSTTEMLEDFAYLGEEKAREVVIENPKLVASWVGEVALFPTHPEGKETFQPFWPDAADQIRSTVEENALRQYGTPLPEIVSARIDKELSAIIGYGFGTLYRVAQLLVEKSLSDGYLVGSRGSVGSSLVATLCGITEVNPLPPHYRCGECGYVSFEVGEGARTGPDLPPMDCPACAQPLIRDGFDIPFEVFLGFEGDKVPDIDLNFSGDYQGKAHSYVEQLFGKGNCFRAGTIGTLAEKTAYGYAAKYYEERNLTPTEAEKRRLAAQCVGVKRTTGQHPGGMVVVPEGYSIYQFTAIQHPADDPETPIITTHYDFGSMHDVLVKLDILGHDDPTMIHMLESLTGVKALTLDLTDPAVMSLFTSVEALGVTPEQVSSVTGVLGIPEFGTRFVRQMLETTKPTTMEELIRISGLSHGTDVWLGNAQTLIEEGTATLSECICTRDDIMNTLMGYGVAPKMSFDTMESVRKGKGLTPAMEQAMVEKDVPAWFIESCKKIKYMFPKGHAVAYVMMALRIAWYKINRPDAYYAAFYTIRAGALETDILYADIQTLTEWLEGEDENGKQMTAKEKERQASMEIVREMLARGLRFAPIDLYRSDPMRFVVLEPGLLLPPLTVVSGLGETAAGALALAREQGPFTSVEDMKERTRLSSANVEALRLLGCLEALPETSQISLFSDIDNLLPGMT